MEVWPCIRTDIGKNWTFMMVDEFLLGFLGLNILEFWLTVRLTEKMNLFWKQWSKHNKNEESQQLGHTEQWIEVVLTVLQSFSQIGLNSDYDDFVVISELGLSPLYMTKYGQLTRKIFCSSWTRILWISDSKFWSRKMTARRGLEGLQNQQSASRRLQRRQKQPPPEKKQPKPSNKFILMSTCN